MSPKNVHFKGNCEYCFLLKKKLEIHWCSQLASQRIEVDVLIIDFKVDFFSISFKVDIQEINYCTKITYLLPSLYSKYSKFLLPQTHCNFPLNFFSISLLVPQLRINYLWPPFTLKAIPPIRQQQQPLSKNSQYSFTYYLSHITGKYQWRGDYDLKLSLSILYLPRLQFVSLVCLDHTNLSLSDHSPCVHKHFQEN